MKNTPLKTLGALLFSVLVIVLPAHAQVGTPKWNFRNRAQVAAATRKYKLDLRQSYNIIICATRQGMIRTVVHTYEQMMPANVFDVPPEMASSFALAHRMMMGGNRWDWKLDTTPNITQTSAADSLKVMLYRDRALQMLPRSPEVLISYAIWAEDYGEKRAQALQLSEKATRLAPRWADAHYWHSVMISGDWIMLSHAEQGMQGPRCGAAELRALNTAVKLDPGFKQIKAGDEWTILQTMRRSKEALASFDAYTRARPDFAVFWDKRFGNGQFKRMHDALAAKAQKQ